MFNSAADMGAVPTDHIDVAPDRLRDARCAIAAHLRPTPLVDVDGRYSLGGNPILLKAESLQPGGSFKIRGALNVIIGLLPEQRRQGVIAYSTGNHARAVAMAARQFGASATIVMSPDAPAAKIDATQRLGAKIVMAEPTANARRALAEALAREHALSLIPPYDHLGIIAGQGTLGLELLDAGMPRPAAVFVPIGGGGLIAGVAACIKQLDPTIKVIGVEPEWENDAGQSFRHGARVALDGPSASMADAIKVQTLGDLTFPLIQRFVDDIVSVTEDEIADAMRVAVTASRLVLEPAGAVALAAALSYSRPESSGMPLVAIASGGNVETGRLCSLTGSCVRSVVAPTGRWRRGFLRGR
jgi:threonine dehydratase